MRTLPQQSHADLGLVDDDNTEDLRNESAPGRCANTAEGDRTPTQPLSKEKVLMTTIPTTVDPVVSPGAVPDLWVGGQRDVYAQVGYVATSGDLLKCPAITVVGEQRTNGHLGQVQVVLDVALTKSHAVLTATQARELAALLVAGADLADEWAGADTRLTPVELLADAFSALRVAHSQLAVLPGNADSYVQAALDSISEAAEVLR